jgi:hypothetical protein
MTPEQLATLKAAILADPALAAFPRNSDGAFAIAQELNKTASPAFIVWRRNIPASEMGQTVIYNALAAMTTANTSRVDLFVAMNRETFAGSADLDSYFASTFSGALNGDGANCRTALAAMLRRACTRFERIFASGTGSTASPATMALESPVSPASVEAARNLP